MTGRAPRWFVAVVAAALIVAAAAARAGEPQQSTDDTAFSLLSPSMYGVDNFHAYCSPCHGRDGKGRGPVAGALKTPPPDLTTLAARNRGVFPRDRVRNYITNGAEDVAAHGNRAMPVWGPTFRSLDSSDRSVALRIANTVEYLASIQR